MHTRRFLFQGNEIGYIQVTSGLVCIYTEKIVMSWTGFEFPQILYSSLFLCFSLICIWKGFSAIIFPSSVTSPWKVAYGSVCRAGGKAKVYVLGIYYWFWVFVDRVRAFA